MQLEEFETDITVFAEVILPLSLQKTIHMAFQKNLKTQLLLEKEWRFNSGKKDIRGNYKNHS